MDTSHTAAVVGQAPLMLLNVPHERRSTPAAHPVRIIPMQAIVIDAFGQIPELHDVPDPEPGPGEAVVRVAATGLCRSDWHAYAGHDPDIALPHVPGHEFAGVIEAVGPGVTRWRVGDRVTAPFVYACGRCAMCLAGDQQVCDDQTQPGFSRWGSFAPYVAVEHAEVNLVGLPAAVEMVSAASLGCRFATAYRAVLAVGGVRAGDWVAVHGCGGVGLSAVMIAVTAGARVVAIDTSAPARELASTFGAEAVVDASSAPDPAEVVRDLTGGGAHVSLDAVGHPDTCAGSVRSLRKRGRHVQVGLLPAVLGNPAVPMERVISHELAILGAHGMAAHAYTPLLALVGAGRLRPDLLVTRRIALVHAGAALAAMGSPGPPGITVIIP